MFSYKNKNTTNKKPRKLHSEAGSYIKAIKIREIQKYTMGLIYLALCLGALNLQGKISFRVTYVNVILGKNTQKISRSGKWKMY